MRPIIAKEVPNSLNSFPSFLNLTHSIMEKTRYQFGFQNRHSTDHAIVHLIDQICESFANDNYILGVFIDLSKVFHTVDHSILLKKIRNVRCQYHESCLVCQLLQW